jgi:hypothetical protein
MYKIVMIVGTIMVVGGWIAYGVWRYKIHLDEKKNPAPKQRSEHLEKVQKSLDEYAKKMAEYKRKPYERE